VIVCLPRRLLLFGTRLIEFGRFAAQNRERRGLGKPETFKFLGFVLISGKSRRGDFQIRRKSRSDRMSARLRQIKEVLRERRHVPVPAVGQWLAQVVAGYFAYSGPRRPGRIRRPAAAPARGGSPRLMPRASRR
jgi:hypothetical protein